MAVGYVAYAVRELALTVLTVTVLTISSHLAGAKVGDKTEGKKCASKNSY